MIIIYYSYRLLSDRHWAISYGEIVAHWAKCLDLFKTNSQHKHYVELLRKMWFLNVFTYEILLLRDNKEKF